MRTRIESPSLFECTARMSRILQDAEWSEPNENGEIRGTIKLDPEYEFSPIQQAAISALGDYIAKATGHNVDRSEANTGEYVFIDFTLKAEHYPAAQINLAMEEAKKRLSQGWIPENRENGNYIKHDIDDADMPVLMDYLSKRYASEEQINRGSLESEIHNAIFVEYRGEIVNYGELYDRLDGSTSALEEERDAYFFEPDANGKMKPEISEEQAAEFRNYIHDLPYTHCARIALSPEELSKFAKVVGFPDPVSQMSVTS